MGFEATVRRGVYATRGEAKVAAEEKTVANTKRAIARVTTAKEEAVASFKATLDGLKTELKEAEARLAVAQAALKEQGKPE